MAEFLLEIGLEEIPARMIAGAQAELARRVVELLVRERLLAKGMARQKSYSTPRRLAVLVEDVLLEQEDVSEELTGPAAKIAYKDGVPGPAAIAFAKKAGVPVESLAIVETAKGEYLTARVTRRGRTAVEVIAEELPKEIASIYWAKNMYWRAGKPERFVRPVEWLVALLGEHVVPLSFAGVTAGRLTYGHRVLHGSEPVQLPTPGEYEGALRSAFVIANPDERRHLIRKDLDRVTRTVMGARWREDEPLVETVVHLTEWPTVLLGSFAAEYLELPEEVLVTVMRDHQKYFAVEDREQRLAPHFLTVLNTQPESEDGGDAVIRHGNERVLRARFNDARFFWEFDQRVPLVDRVPLLEKVTFQKDLGSYAAKSERVAALAAALGKTVKSRWTPVDMAGLQEAARLAKTDLTSELVKEFTELQGIVGGLYARAQGASETVETAIYDQYLPQSMNDRVPKTVEGQLLAVADKTDTIVGMFGLGLEPTGSKDPFALRRAANGVVKILAETRLPLTLAEIVAATGLSMDEPGGTAVKVSAFLAERVEFYLREAAGQEYDVVAAVLAAGRDDVPDAVARARAVSAVRESEDFAAVSAAFKRMKNILAQAAEKGIAPASTVDGSLLTDPTEQALARNAAVLADRVIKLRAAREYVGALEQIATLRPVVDAFFDAVMVMAPDPAVRANRLALLAKVLGDFSGIADFSEIVVQG
jgi:glycyl-tRNA synthetase beta chain